jgi:2-methylisocitrate lyase-like PEP mutase family enzyme
MLASLGARALATSSAAHAFTLGRIDGQVTRDEALAHAEALVAATPLPVSGDFEDGFGAAPGVVAETIRLAAEAGLSGCSVEDISGTDRGPCDFELAVERVAAAAAAARALRRPFVFCARADGVMTGSYGMAEGLRRLRAFAAVGADAVFLPLPPDLAALRAVLAATDKPVNVLAAGFVKGMTVAALAALGVRRISTGSQIARLTHAAIRDAGRAMLQDGSFAPLAGTAPGDEIDALLAQAGAR